MEICYENIKKIEEKLLKNGILIKYISHNNIILKIYLDVPEKYFEIEKNQTIKFLETEYNYEIIRYQQAVLTYHSSIEYND